MAKTNEELAQIKNEYESLTNKLKELTEDELNKVTGGQKRPLIYTGTIKSVIGGALINIAKDDRAIVPLCGINIPLDTDSKLKKD